MKSSKRFNSILHISFAIETSIESHCVCVISVVHCGIFWKTHSSWPTTTRTTFNCWIHLKLWTCCGQTHDKHRESPFHSLPTPCWTQFSGWLSFICCHRVHTSIVSSSSVFGVAFRLPTLCEMGLIAGIWCKKNGLICACSRTRTGTSSRTMLSLTGQDIPLQVISRICYARVAACDNNYNCNYINCNITEWANESTCEREGERDGRVIYCRTDWETAKCVGFSVSCSSSSSGLSSLGSSAYSWLLHTTNWILCKGFALCPPSNALFSNHHSAQLLALSFRSFSLLPLFRCSGCFRWRRHLWSVVRLNNNLVFCFPFWLTFCMFCQAERCIRILCLSLCFARLLCCFLVIIFACVSYFPSTRLHLPALPNVFPSCFCFCCCHYSLLHPVVFWDGRPQFAGLTLMRNYVIALLSCCSCVWVCKNAFFYISRVNCQHSVGINCYYDYGRVIRIVGLQLSL